MKGTVGGGGQELQDVDLARSLVEENEQLKRENAELRARLEHGVIIEQAKGAISVRFDVGPETALDMLCGFARSQGRDVHEYAADVVAGRGRVD